MDINQKNLPGSRSRFPSFSSTLLESIDRSIDNDARMDRAAAAAAARRKPIAVDFEHLREDLITFRRSFAAEKQTQSRRSGPNRGTLSDYDFKTTDTANHPRPKPIRTEKKKTMMMKKKKMMMSPQSGSGERMFVAASPLGYGRYVSKPMATARQIQSRSWEEQQPPKANREGRFKRTKSKAIKMYGDMKRLNQQPISPGARIASFLNSIFHSSDSKKSSKACSVDPTPPSRPKSPKSSFSFSSHSSSSYSSSSSSSASTCSSYLSSMAELRSQPQQSKASATAARNSSSSLSKIDRKSSASATFTTNTSSCPSSTRSCLRSSPRGYRIGGGGDVGGGGGAKRCVRFSPVSVIIDEDGGCDSRLSGRKSRCESDPGLTPTPILRTRSRAVQMESPTARNRHGPRNNHKKDRRHQDRRGGDDEMDEDTISFSSSDLFELDFLIGFERYREELPVYETTDLHTNHAIANKAFHCC